MLIQDLLLNKDEKINTLAATIFVYKDRLDKGAMTQEAYLSVKADLLTEKAESADDAMKEAIEFLKTF